MKDTTSKSSRVIFGCQQIDVAVHVCGGRPVQHGNVPLHVGEYLHATACARTGRVRPGLVFGGKGSAGVSRLRDPDPPPRLILFTRSLHFGFSNAMPSYVNVPDTVRCNGSTAVQSKRVVHQIALGFEGAA